MDSEIINLVATYGIPTVFCLWFMFRLEKILTTHTETCQNNGLLLTELLNIMRKNNAV